MKFIIDAQLPKRLSSKLTDMGYDSVHTLDLPLKNKTSDSQISELSMSEGRIVISKDSDFYNRYLQKAEPYKLIYLTTGNISNNELMELFEKNLPKILHEIEYGQVIELTSNSLITII